MTRPLPQCPPASMLAEEMRRKLWQASDAVMRAQSTVDKLELSRGDLAYLDVQVERALADLASARAKAIMLADKLPTRSDPLADIFYDAPETGGEA